MIKFNHILTKEEEKKLDLDTYIEYVTWKAKVKASASDDDGEARAKDSNGRNSHNLHDDFDER